MVFGKGNRRNQKKRRRKNNKDVEKQQYEYKLIDNNYSCQPYGYCNYHKGYLTKNQCLLHNCENKKCNNFEKFKLKLIFISKWR